MAVKVTDMAREANLEYICPKCGHNHTVGSGYTRKLDGFWARRKCMGCGKTFYPDTKPMEGK